ncbi:hypothetical protein Q0O75_13210, partial [Staphylococcus aureus]|nr:hypothetical protein [Staphylococcus aureus]
NGRNSAWPSAKLNTQTASPRALADSLMQLARQVSRLESGQ